MACEALRKREHQENSVEPGKAEDDPRNRARGAFQRAAGQQLRESRKDVEVFDAAVKGLEELCEIRIVELALVFGDFVVLGKHLAKTCDQLVAKGGFGSKRPNCTVGNICTFAPKATEW